MQVQALSGLLSLNAWDVGCDTGQAQALSRLLSLNVWDVTPVHPRPAGCKSLPKQGKTAEKVEIPVAAVQESLPK